MNNFEKSEPVETLPKSFEDLIVEVHQRGICGQCGGCVSFCSANEIKAIYMAKDGPPAYLNQDNCLHCGICYLICPQIHAIDSDLKEKFNWKYPIGYWHQIASAQAASEEILDVATDGGVVTAILMYLLENNMIDGAIVTKRTGFFSRKSFFATTKEDLIEAAGTKFDLPTQILEYEKFTTFTPIIVGLKELMDADRMNIAVVGTPCQIHSIRKMQLLGIMPAHVIKYVLGLFCFENFVFTTDSWKKMETKFNFSINDIEKINVKDNVIFYLRDSNPKNVEFSDMKEFMRPACSACDDFSNYFSDISFGGLGSEDKFTTTLIRTKIGSEIYKKALNAGYILEPSIKKYTNIKIFVISQSYIFCKNENQTC